MNWIEYAIAGRLVIWAIQTTSLLTPLFSAHAKLKDLVSCDFCLGFWVYTSLAFVFRINLFTPIYVLILSEALTGLTISFLAHLTRLGWETKFGINLGEFHDDVP